MRMRMTLHRLWRILFRRAFRPRCDDAAWQSQENKATDMAINFPNSSRSYDATRHAVRFWGYDRSMESSFFVSAEALKQIEPDLRFDAAELLRAFDSNRDRIYAIAAKVYARGRRGSYDLVAADV
jgi:hypothetical protein